MTARCGRPAQFWGIEHATGSTKVYEGRRYDTPEQWIIGPIINQAGPSPAWFRDRALKPAEIAALIDAMDNAAEADAPESHT